MKKATGIIRRVDDLGRVVIPKEIRRALEYRDDQPLEVIIQKDGDVLLRKFERGCVFCGSVRELRAFNTKVVCKFCAKRIAAEQTRRDEVLRGEEEVDGGENT